MCSENKVTLGLLLIFFCVVSQLVASKIDNVKNVKNVATTSTVTPVDQFAVESQLPVGKIEPKDEAKNSSSITTTTASIKTKGRKPSCYILFKDMEAPPGYGSTKGKIKMACTICNYRGYQENCVFADKHIMKELSDTDDVAESSKPFVAQESQQSATYQESTEALPGKKSNHYVPVYETTAESADESKHGLENDGIADRMESKNEEREEEPVHQRDNDDKEDDSVDESKDRKNDDDSANESDDKDDKRGFQSYDDGPDFRGRASIIPEEYMESEYDPQFYEDHDEAAEAYHAYVFSKSPYEMEGGKESRRSSSSVMPGFDVLRSVLPDVEPINPDKDVKPRKRQKTIEFTEQVSFSSDDDNDKKSSSRRPTIDYKGQHSNNDNYYQPTEYGGSGRESKSSKGHGHGHGPSHYEGYDMPAFDSKDCTVRYKDSPQGGPRMKCVKCNGKSNAYSEECGVEYEQPTKHREVTYNAQNYNADPKDVMGMMYGNMDRAYSEMPGLKNAPYYGGNPYGPRRNKGSASITHTNYMPFKGYYNPHY